MENKLSGLNIFAILCIFTGLAEFTVLTPALAVLQEHFSNYAYTTIVMANTITGVVSVPVSIISGAIVNKIGFRKMAVAGFIVMIVGGCYPFFMPNLTSYGPIILSRVLVGVGTGMIFPLGAALIISHFTGALRARYLGIGMAVQMAFGTLFSIVAGCLTLNGWNWDFLTYGISIIPLIFVALWCPEAGHAAEAEQAELAAAGKQPLPKAMWGYVAFGLVFWSLFVVINFLAPVLAGTQFPGDSSTSGLLAGVLCIGCVVSGLLFGPILKVFKRFTFFLGLLCICVGLFCAFYAGTAALFGIGAFLCGFGSSIVFTACNNSVGNIVPPSRVSFASGIMNAMMNAASFFAAYYLSFAQGIMPASMGAGSPLFLSGCIFAVFTIASIFFPFKALTNRKAPEEIAEKSAA